MARRKRQNPIILLARERLLRAKVVHLPVNVTQSELDEAAMVSTALQQNNLNAVDTAQKRITLLFDRLFTNGDAAHGTKR